MHPLLVQAFLLSVLFKNNKKFNLFISFKHEKEAKQNISLLRKLYRCYQKLFENV